MCAVKVRVLLLLLFLCSVALGQDARLEWHTGTLGAHQNPRRVPLSESPPPGFVVPQEMEGALFGWLPFGDSALLIFALTEDRLWIDRDLDGDLKEELPLALMGSRKRRHRSVYLQVPFVGEKERAQIQVLIVYNADKDPPVAQLTPRAYRRGTVVLAGRLRKVVLVDGDGDLRFEHPDRDLLFVDLDGNGKVKTSGASSHEELRAGLPFHLRRKGFTARIPSIGGGRVVFTETEPAPPPPRRPWTMSERIPAGIRAPRRGNLVKLEADYRGQIDSSLGSIAWRRSGVVRQIGWVGTPEAGALLLRIHKKDTDQTVKTAAVQALGYLDYGMHAAKVVKITRGARDLQEQIAGIRALHGMNAQERGDAYSKLLRSARQELVCAEAAKYLAFTGTQEARTALLAAAQSHPKLRHRYHAYVAGTRYFRTPPPVEAMQAAARAPDPRLAAQGLRDLHSQGRPEAREMALAAGRAAVRGTELAMVLTEILGAEGDAASVRTLLPLAQYDSATLQERLLDLLRLVRDPGGLDVLRGGVSSRAPGERVLCARVLGGIVRPELTEALSQQLSRERDTEVARELIRALGRHHSAPAIVAAAKRLGRNEELRKPILRVLSDIGMGDADVRDYFEARMQSRKWEERILAIDAAARAGATPLAPAVIANLDYNAWQVRLAAVQALRRLRVVAAIQPLIERLDQRQEPEKRIRRAIGETLHRLTGQRFYDDADLWIRWWAANRDGFEIPEKIEEQRGTGTRTVARFYGLPVESDRVVFVIDKSGSMGSRARSGKTELQVAVDEVLKVAKRLKSGARVNVILFASRLIPWKKRLVGLNISTRSALRKHLEAQEPSGGTNIYDALEMALRHDGVDTIFFLSDGAPVTGKYVTTPEILRGVRELNELRRITIHCVSLGGDSNLVRQLAAQNGGRYTRR